MDITKQFDPLRLSHAYLIESSRPDALMLLEALMKHLDIAVNANPDHVIEEQDVFKLEHAQELRRKQGMRSSLGGKKIFVVLFNTITGEAQNALLKTLEEPTEDTHFFFVVENHMLLLPTLRSRMQIIVHSPEGSLSRSALAKDFLKGAVSVRMNIVQKMTKAKKEDKGEAKEEARAFLRALEHELYDDLKRGQKALVPSLEHVLYAKHELGGRAPSIKLLLEHLALTVPTIQ